MAEKMNLRKLDKDMLKQQTPLISLGIFLIGALVMILVSYFVLGIPLVAVCTIVVLEALLCALLNQIPLWIHGIIVIGQVVAGVMVHKTVFMVLMAVVYIAAVTFLYLWTSKKEA